MLLPALGFLLLRQQLDGGRQVSYPGVVRQDVTLNRISCMIPGDVSKGNGGELVKSLRTRALSGGFIIAQDGTISQSTGGANQILGFAAGEVDGKFIGSLPQPLVQLFEDCQTTGKFCPRCELEISVPPRGKVWVEVSGMCLGTDHDRAMAIILTDLTAISNLEKELRRLDRLASVGTLSASMAHEIKNALVAGKTFLDLLIEKHQDAELVEVVRHEMSRIDSIVSQVLNFAGRTRPLPGTIRLHDLLDHCLQLLQPEFQRKFISVRSAFGAEEDSIKGDPHQLQQAFMNLLLNSLDATEDGGAINLSTESLPPDPSRRASDTSFDRKRIRIIIQDSGAGISAENLAQLFEPFFTTKASGTGLGLPITRQIILEHHGTIAAASEIGKGAVFTIVLPLAVQPSPAGQALPGRS